MKMRIYRNGPNSDIGFWLDRSIFKSGCDHIVGRQRAPIPFNSNSPIGSTVTALSTFVSTRGLMSICPGLASSHSREATLDTVPMAA